jgi:hypothetical protein
MKTTGLQICYLVLAIIGLFATWYFNIQPREHGFITDLYANSASSSIANDLFVVVVAFLVWSFFETGRLHISYWWWTAGFIFTFLMAAAVTVPLYFLLRERQLITLAKTASDDGETVSP